MWLAAIIILNIAVLGVSYAYMAGDKEFLVFTAYCLLANVALLMAKYSE